jgi:hypothetical protein
MSNCFENQFKKRIKTLAHDNNEIKGNITYI